MGGELALDPHDSLRDACRNSGQYPYTLLKRNISRADADWNFDYLAQNKDVLFDNSSERLVLWEAWPGGQGFKATKIQNTKELSEHLIRDEVDPKSRHVFIESDHSRAPLNCSSDMLKKLLTYHQVNPSFLDSLFAFGDQDEPLDAGLAQFRSDDTLAMSERLTPIAVLGRSGREIRHSFLLRSVERAEGATDPWSIRQLAVYHSFDVVNGRSVWITVKGNDLLQRRVMEDSIGLPIQHGAMGSDVGASFEASLSTHLIFFRWCEQNWRWYVRDIENRIRRSLVRAKTIPVESEPHFTRPPPKTDTGFSTSSKGSAAKFPVFPSGPERPTVLESFKRHLRPRRVTFDPFSKPVAEYPEPHSNSRKTPEGILVLNMFNYKDLQKLSILAERLEEAILVLQLDLGALQDIYDYYKGLMQTENHPTGTQRGCSYIQTVDPTHANNRNDNSNDQVDIPEKLMRSMEKSVPPFLHKLRQIIRGLEIRQTQLASLRKRLDSGKSLYENLLQLRSLQVSRIFAEHGHRSAINMENIARRTERETVSMHTVTVVTLLFLPATFLGTFFQSGVFQWGSTVADAGDSWLFRTDVFRLFMAICVPMTVLTMFAWLVVNTLAKLRARKEPPEIAVPAATVTPNPGIYA